MFDRIESIINKHKGRCDYLEIRVESYETCSISLRARNVENIKESIALGGCVRAFYKGGVGFATFNDLEKMEEFTALSVQQARLIGEEKTVLGDVEIIQDEVKVSIINDPRVVSLQKKVEILSAYNDVILGLDPKIKSSSISYQDQFKIVYFMNSEGTRIKQEKMDIEGGLTGIAQQNGQTQYGNISFGSSSDFNCVFDHEKEIEKECRLALEFLDAPSIKGGTYTVIADPILSGVFVHEAFGHTSEGDFFIDNPDLQKVMALGRKIGSDILNIYDTGLTPGSRGHIVYDDEGVRAQKTDLIQNGFVVGRLHSRETAARMNEKPTGSARAVNFQFPPIPRMRETCIAPGNSTLEEMLSDIKLGVYAVKALGGQGGEMFTFTPARCYMIRSGRIEEMVKNATLSGNLFTTLMHIDRIGSDFKRLEIHGGCGKGGVGGFQFPLPVAKGAPHIRIQNVVIGGQ